jgi:hypothetical protein
LPTRRAASDTLKNKTRNIPTYAASVVGPAARSCGSCHRAEDINEDNAVGFNEFENKIKALGYYAATTSSGTTDIITANDSTTKEACAGCHKGQGAKHQATYEELYQDSIIKITDFE